MAEQKKDEAKEKESESVLGPKQDSHLSFPKGLEEKP